MTISQELMQWIWENISSSVQCHHLTQELRFMTLRATTACTFSTSQVPKVAWEWCALYILTWKCASRHNGVNFFDISTSKSGLRPSVFYTFDLGTCFAPQRRALFRQLNFQEWSETVGFWHRKCASRHNGARFFISHLASWLGTRRFSEVTFRPSGAPNHWKNTVNRDFPTFSCSCIFFLLSLSLLWSSHFLSSPPWRFTPFLSICPHCGKFGFCYLEAVITNSWAAESLKL